MIYTFTRASAMARPSATAPVSIGRNRLTRIWIATESKKQPLICAWVAVDVSNANTAAECNLGSLNLAPLSIDPPGLCRCA